MNVVLTRKTGISLGKQYIEAGRLTRIIAIDGVVYHTVKAFCGSWPRSNSFPLALRQVSLEAILHRVSSSSCMLWGRSYVPKLITIDRKSHGMNRSRVVSVLSLGIHSVRSAMGQSGGERARKKGKVERWTMANDGATYFSTFYVLSLFLSRFLLAAGTYEIRCPPYFRTVARKND